MRLAAMDLIWPMIAPTRHIGRGDPAGRPYVVRRVPVASPTGRPYLRRLPARGMARVVAVFGPPRWVGRDVAVQ